MTGKLDLSVAVFSGEEHVKNYLAEPFSVFNQVHFVEARMTAETAKLAKGFDAVCLFVNDDADAEVIAFLTEAWLVRPIIQDVPAFAALPLDHLTRHRYHTFLGLLAKIKCSICSFQFDR